MNTILIPLDFSAGTQNALNYVASASRDNHVSRVILLKSMYTSVYQPIIATAEYLCLDERVLSKEREDALEHMQEMTQKLLQKLDMPIHIDNALSELPLPRAILQLIEQEQPDLLVLNSGLKGDVGYISNNLIMLVTISTVPVLVIPPNAAYQRIDKVMVPIDFEELDRLIAFKNPLFLYRKEKPFLDVFSIKKLKRDEAKDRERLAILLAGFDFSVHYTENNDILAGILDFAKKTDPAYIVALPGKYNFFKKLTHRSISQAIANKSVHPVLVLKQD